MSHRKPPVPVLSQASTIWKDTENGRRDGNGKGEAEKADMKTGFSSIRVAVLCILCFQNSVFTLLRRYSLGVLKESYSKYEVLVFGEIIKIIFCIFVISRSLQESGSSSNVNGKVSIVSHCQYLVTTSGKMFMLALIYGAMNTLSFVALQNIGAGIFTILAQCKILSTASFSTIILGRQYSWGKWRALTALMLGVVLFSEPIWGNPKSRVSNYDGAVPILGVTAVLIEVTLSGFASIYFEKVIKVDTLNFTIWERNFQLAIGSIPVYFLFILYDYQFGGKLIGSGWSLYSLMLSLLGAAGGLLVALSIKYGDSILKTLATTGAIVLSSILDHYLLGGPLTPTMMIAAAQVIIAICNYTFDQTTITSTSNKGVIKLTEEDIATSKCMTEEDGENDRFVKGK